MRLQPGSFQRGAVANIDILFAYVDGNDLDEVAPRIEASLAQFVDEHEWSSSPPWVVNHQLPRDASMDDDELPDWDLGLNMHLPAPGAPPGPQWVHDILTIAEHLHVLAKETERGFVLGIGDSRQGSSEDLMVIDERPVDVQLLRRCFGAPRIAASMS